MINLRYHIVSLTAVFLAIGIGVTLGSTFLDRATVENLNGQLESLDTRLRERNEEITQLEDELERSGAIDEALDEQAPDLLAGRLDGLPLVVVTARGADEDDIAGTIRTATVAGADVQGIWWITDRWALDDGSEVDDLAAVLELPTTDPSRLRRTAITRLGGQLQAVQSFVPAEDPGTDEVPTDDVPVDGATSETTVVGVGDTPEGQTGDPVDDGAVVEEVDDAELVALLGGLVETGFLEFEAVPGGPEAITFPVATRIVFAAGSTVVPDDLVIEPLIGRMAAVEAGPVLAVVGSAAPEEDVVSDAVAVVREGEELREQVPTVDTLEHFHGWAAMVLALADVADGVVGHYGLDDGATRLLPPLPSP